MIGAHPARNPMAECALNGSLGGIAAKALLIANTAPSSPSATGLKGLPITGILRAALRCQGFPQTTVSGRVRPLGLRGGANRHSCRCTRAWSGIPSRNIGGSRSCLPPGSGRKKDRAQADRNRHQLHPPQPAPGGRSAILRRRRGGDVALDRRLPPATGSPLKAPRYCATVIAGRGLPPSPPPPRVALSGMGGDRVGPGDRGGGDLGDVSACTSFPSDTTGAGE